MFGELRDLNFSSVGKTLNKHARRLDDDYKVNNLSLRLERHSFDTGSDTVESFTGEDGTTVAGFRR